MKEMYIYGCSDDEIEGDYNNEFLIIKYPDVKMTIKLVDDKK